MYNLIFGDFFVCLAYCFRMSYRSDGESSPNEDDNISENELDINDQEQNAFVTDDAFVELPNQQDDDGMKPIEAKPPIEIDTDEQMRHQSGTPAFRSLDEVCISFCNSICSVYSFSLTAIQTRSLDWYANGMAQIEIYGFTECLSTVIISDDLFSRSIDLSLFKTGHVMQKRVYVTKNKPIYLRLKNKNVF